MRGADRPEYRHRVHRFLAKDIWQRDLASLPGPQAFLFRQLRVVLLVGRGFVKDKCGLRAAGLTYITLLSLIPFLAAVFSMFQAFGPGLQGLAEDHLKPAIYRALAFDTDVRTAPDGGEPVPPGEEGATPRDGDADAAPGDGSPGEPEVPEGTEQPDAPDEAPGPRDPGLLGGEEAAAVRSGAPDEAGAVAVTDPGDEPAEGVEEKRQRISTTIDGLVSRVSRRRIGWLATLLMLLTAVGLLTNIERSFNDIWGVRRSRSWVKRITLYWTGITLGSICVGGSLAIAATVQSSSVVTWVVDNLHVPQNFFTFFFPFILTCVAFSILYLTMPNTKVNLLSGLVGGVVAAALWEGGKWGYTVYAANTIKWDEFYGTLGAIPVFLIWVYLTWVILLFGCELTFAHQHAATYQEEEPSLQASPRYREVLILGLLSRVGREYRGGGAPPSSQKLAEGLRVPVRLVEDLLFQLTKYGLIVEAAGTEKSPGYLPARPLDHLRIQEVVDIVRHDAPVDLTLPAGEETGHVTILLDRADGARGEVFGDRTMSDLLDGRVEIDSAPAEYAGEGAEGIAADSWSAPEAAYPEESPPGEHEVDDEGAWDLSEGLEIPADVAPDTGSEPAPPETEDEYADDVPLAEVTPEDETAGPGGDAPLPEKAPAHPDSRPDDTTP